MNIFQRFIYGRESGGTRKAWIVRKLPPEGQDGPETFAKRPGGPAIPSPEGKEVPHDQKFA